MKPVRILFVCLGNICRSPLAEGLMRDLASRAGHSSAIVVDSAGTGAWHIGDPPDRRSIAVARAHRIDIAGLRGRKIGAADFAAFDLILGMDSANVRDLLALAPSTAAEKVHLFMHYAAGRHNDVPDPYYETADAFEALYQMLEAGCSSLLAKLERAS
ncbi:low molecular weight phosphotyrosine protein phosphatase [Sinorhizobium numidicum]|uniref:protein-tyrosine-phosphatase n=1 Tax=Sinorhizobium numidicum TaxID=680248 RepID=A0ABY8D2R4_9HYPH|nr:low molecular weight protein-tyrosine-phosphatase [Sinorhizobium numidicum]WEX77313.1 low molecular weight phosphotyrosine protein phosphatase [Sinorhizobium numidicum]WEX83972.1 low molecular weight phosphotyrosine protein phosphatase [Sinorhizobium numidicum]